MGGGSSKKIKATENQDQEKDSQNQNSEQLSDLENDPNKSPKQKVQPLGFKGDDRDDEFVQNKQKKDKEKRTFRRKNNENQQTSRTNFDNNDDLYQELPKKPKNEYGYQQNLSISDDLSPIQKKFEMTVSEQDKRNNEKISNVQTQLKGNETQFQWSQQGSCNVISVKFGLLYDPKDYTLKITNSYHSYTTSKLMWKFNGQKQVYDFILQDEEVYDVKDNQSYQVTGNRVEFMVAPNGQFVGISNESEFVQKIQEINKKIKKQQQMKRGPKKKPSKSINPEKLIKQTEDIIGQMWKNVIQTWSNKANLKEVHKKQSKKSYGEEYEMLNRSLDKFQKIQVQPKEDLEYFLNQQLGREKFYNACFRSKKTIKDRLRLWQVDEDQESDARSSQQNDINNIGITGIKRIIEDEFPELLRNQQKVKFPVLEKFEMVQGQLEKDGCKPYVVTSNIGKKLVMQNDERDLFVDVFQNMDLYIFQWDNRTMQENQVMFHSEYSQFKDQCDIALQRTVKQLRRVSNLPMQFRCKSRSSYLQ